MRKLCRNLSREDGLDTVLEVPIPEEMFGSPRRPKSGCTNMKAWMRPHIDRQSSAVCRRSELQLMLGVIGAPLVPLPVHAKGSAGGNITNNPIEISMAKYIVQQYIAAAGGDKALDKITSMYAMGKVRMAASEFRTAGNGSKKGGGWGEMGGFVLWQKKPDLWCLELVVSGCKISAGSDGRVAWRQTPWHQSHASRGPPRPLRRSLQGLDPRSTANLFSAAVCIGEKAMNGDDCFVLRVDAEAATLRARSCTSVEIIRHTVWGYFSQRTGLLVQLEDTNLLRIKSGGEESVYWETTMESLIEDYRPVDGINVAHAGRTAVSLFRFGDTADGHTRTRMEEAWTVEEVDFNIWGLSMDCFLPPGDLKQETQGGGGGGGGGCDVLVNKGRPPIRAQPTAVRIDLAKVAAVNIEDSDSDSDSDSTQDSEDLL